MTQKTLRTSNTVDASTTQMRRTKLTRKLQSMLRLRSKSNSYIVLVVKQILRAGGVPYVDDGYNDTSRRNFNFTYIALLRNDRHEVQSVQRENYT